MQRTHGIYDRETVSDARALLNSLPLAIPDKLKQNSRLGMDVVSPELGGESWTNIRLISKCGSRLRTFFEHYAAQSEYYKRANVVQRFAMEDAFYRLTMELLRKIIGPV